MPVIYSKELLAPRQTHKVEDHLLSAVRLCSFNIFATTLHTGGRSSCRNLRTRHAAETATNLSLEIRLSHKFTGGHVVAQLVQALRYKPEALGFAWSFSLT